MTLCKSLITMLFTLGLSLPSHLVAATDNSAPDPELGRIQRQLFFDVSPSLLNLKPNAEHPEVFGVAMDWPVKDNIATVISFSEGTASVYLNTGFMIAGGYAAASSAKAFVREAERSLKLAAPSTGTPYPAKDKVRFYIRTFNGVRVIEDDMEKLQSRRSQHNALFSAAHQVMGELFNAAKKAPK